MDVLVRHQIFWNSFSRREVSTDKVVTLFPMTVQSRLRRVARCWQDHRRTGERGMTTKRNFRPGSEPSQLVVIPFPNQKSRLTQIVLRRNPLKQSVVGKPV